MALNRRTLMQAAASTLAAPSLARAQNASVLRFIPQSDVTALDPVWTSVYVTRNHGYLVFDTLYGQDDSLRIQPQMVRRPHHRGTPASSGHSPCATGSNSMTARPCWRGIAWPASGGGRGGMRSGKR